MFPACPAPELLRPDPLAGTAYQAIRRLGGGGTADVYEAVHAALDKRVVVKLLHAELAGQAMALERMRFEAKALARLSHPNLTAVTDFGQTAEGRPFFVMECHEGRLLLTELRRRGFLPVAEAVGLVRQLLAGLSAAHAIGVVHRDLKPENLFLCQGEGGALTLKILDFGIAKLLPGADPSRAPAPRALQTEEGVTVGTPRFLSPEQARCLDVDQRTDVYGAGMVLYELICGRDPFHDVRDYVGLLHAHVSRVPAPPSALAPQPVPAAVDAAVLRALAKRPEDRYPTAADFSEALLRALGEGTMGAGMPAPTDTALKPGDVFRRQLRVLDLLGEGLHGEVYRVEHVHTGVLTALKVLRLEHAKDASRVQHALRMAKASYRIQHENVVAVHDLGCEDDGKVWIQMDLLCGNPLSTVLARATGRISVRLAFHVAISAGWGIDAAHEAPDPPPRHQARQPLDHEPRAGESARLEHRQGHPRRRGNDEENHGPRHGSIRQPRDAARQGRRRTRGRVRARPRPVRNAGGGPPLQRRAAEYGGDDPPAALRGARAALDGRGAPAICR